MTKYLFSKDKVAMLFFAALTFSVLPSYGQDAPTESKAKVESQKIYNADGSEAKKDSGKKFERVQVTGSLIRRSDFEGPSPVEVIDRSTLDKTSYNSVADYIRDQPISSFGATREASGTKAADFSSINLRGLGSSNTLVLLNGLRLPRDGVAGAVNMNLIPEIMIDSVEILKDGASATYGSDAIGGVVALKSRRDFTGIEASTKVSVTEEGGGNRYDIGLIGGKQFSGFGPFTRGSFTAAAQYRFNEELYDKDREWSKPDNIPSTGWSPVGPIPNYLDQNGNITFVDADCNSLVINDAPDRYCAYPYANVAMSLPKVQQFSLYANSELEIGSRNRINATALATRSLTDWTWAASPGQPKDGFTIPGGLAGTIYKGGPLPGTTGSAAVPFLYRTVALGNRVNEVQNDSYYIGLDYSREFGETWQWKTSAAFGSSYRKNRSPEGYALADRLAAAVADGSFNPFDPSTVGGLASAKYKPWQDTYSNTVTVDSQVNGELLTLGNRGILSGAFGTQYIHAQFSDRVDPETEPDPTTSKGNVFGSAGSSGDGKRDIGAAYYELGLTFGKMWEIQQATRFDQFSDFGNAISPKLGVKFRPLDTLMFRASVGKAFKAPLLKDLYASTSEGNPGFIDHVRCEEAKTAGNPNHSSCRASQRLVVSGGNQGLEEEKSTSYNVGFIFEPIKGFAFGSDYWMVQQTNVVGIDYEEMTKAELEKGAAFVASKGIIVERDGNNNITKVIAPSQNLSSLDQSGLDINLSYSFNTSFGAFRIADVHSFTFQVEQAGFPGVAKKDYLDDYGTPKWRNSLSLTYAPNRKHAFSFIYNSLAGQKNVARNGRISSYGELEVSYSTMLPWWKGTSLRAGIKNITGETPPWDPRGGASPFNESLYSQLQRYGYINLRHSF